MKSIWIKIKNFFLGDYDYGFKSYSAMNIENIYLQKSLKRLDFKINTTDDFKNLANNHCAATLVTNLVKFYTNKYINDSDKLDNANNYNENTLNSHTNTNEANINVQVLRTKSLSDQKLFKEIYEYIPNGPIIRIVARAKKYFRSLNINLESKFIKNTSKYIKAINNDTPVALLLADGIFNWHWVLGVGYLIDNRGRIYFQLIDNHHPSSQIYYAPNQGSLLVYGRILILEKPY